MSADWHAIAARAAQQGIFAPEVILPANSPRAVVDAIVAADLLPLFVDVQPGFYVVTWQDFFQAFTERAAAFYVPWTYGNSPEVERIQAACLTYETQVVEERPEDAWDRDAFWALYDRLSAYADRLILPQNTETETEPTWTEFPITARTAETAEALREYGLTPAVGNVTRELDCVWGVAKGCNLSGARTISKRGFVLPCDPEAADAVREALR